MSNPTSSPPSTRPNTRSKRKRAEAEAEQGSAPNPESSRTKGKGVANESNKDVRRSARKKDQKAITLDEEQGDAARPKKKARFAEVDGDEGNNNHEAEEGVDRGLLEDASGEGISNSQNKEGGGEESGGGPDTTSRKKRRNNKRPSQDPNSRNDQSKRDSQNHSRPSPPQPLNTSVLLPKPIKRPQIQGQLRRLTVPRPNTKSTIPRNTLSGAKVGGPSKTLKVDQHLKRNNNKKGEAGSGFEEVIMVTKKKSSMSFGGLVKRGVRGFTHRGITTLHLHALSVAIPLCLNLSAAIASGLPCGPAGLDIKTETESVDVCDEIVPEDEDEDIQYQSRKKSAIHMTLRLKQAIS